MWNQQLWLHWLRVPRLPLLSQPTQVRRRAALCQQLGWTQVWYVSFLHKVLLVVVIAFSALTLLVGHREEHPPRKNWVIRCWCGYLSGEGADYLHMVGPMPNGVLLWLSVWSKVQTCIWSSWCHCHSLSLASAKSRLVFTFLVVAHLGSPGKRAVKRVCVCVCGPMPLSSQNRVISCLIKILNVLPFCMGLSRLSWKKADKRVFVCFIPTITLFLFHSKSTIFANIFTINSLPSSGLALQTPDWHCFFWAYLILLWAFSLLSVFRLSALD